MSETRGLPQTIQVDNGPEFTGRDLDEWAFKNRVKLLFIEPGKPVPGKPVPGKPVQNAVIESFNGKMRHECLNQEWFCGLDEARASIKKWREDYNQFRPHSALDNLAPAVWAQQQSPQNLYAQAR